MDRCLMCGGEIVWEDAYRALPDGEVRRAGYRCASCGHDVCVICGRREIEREGKYCFPCYEDKEVDSIRL